MNNVQAFGALVGRLESNGRYDVIAGYPAHPEATFSNFAEHPYILEPDRERYLGTTASGKYQMVRQTWTMARDALGLRDFSPRSQDLAFAWLLKHKVPGKFQAVDDTGIYELVATGQFDDAIAQLGPEWESFARMAQGNYWMTLAQARDFLAQAGASSGTGSASA